MAQQVLTQFQEHADAWMRVPDIMEGSSFPQSKFIGLQILEKVINTRWKSCRMGNVRCVLICFPGIRNFIVGVTVKVASDEATMRKEKTYLNKLNLALVQFLEAPEFRNVTLKCLAEIAALNVGPEYDPKFVILFAMVMTSVNRMIPPSTNIAQAYANAGDSGQELVLNLALFLCNFLSTHLRAVETESNRDVLLNAHLYMVKISQVDEREIFKICLEYWLKLVTELYDEIQSLPIGESGLLMGLSLGPAGAQECSTVLIVENEEGEIVREFMKESDTIVLYKSMRELLVFLTHLDVADTEAMMTEKLAKQVDGSEWSWNNLNTLCWAIGVQDMACDTFIKIAQKCRRHFVMQQSGEQEPFVDEILRSLHRITVDLSAQQVHTFYEAVGYMISATPNKPQQEKLIAKLMELPNNAWDSLMAQAAQNMDVLSSSDNIKILSNVLKTNVSACTSIGSFYLPQIGRVFLDMLGLYKAVSGIISESVAKDARDAEVLNVMATITGRLGVRFFLVRIFEDADPGHWHA
ncbi:Exportin [Salix suchowensis]|nr:Exportin [Salix suchowensis]